MYGVAYCRVCQKYFNSTDQLSNHENGQSHLAKLQLQTLEKESSSATSDTVTSFQTAEPEIHILNDVSRPSSRNETPVKEMSFTNRLISPQQSHFSGGNEQDYVFDSITKRGKCLICDIDLTSSQHAHQHLSGKSHKKRKDILKLLSTSQGLTSPAGQVQDTAVSPLGLSHYVGRNAPSPQSGVGNVQGPDSNILMCKLCNAPFSSNLNMQQHFAGARHKRELKKRELENLAGEQTLCNISLEQTRPKEVHSGFSPANPSLNDKVLASSSNPVVTSEQYPATDSRGFDFRQVGSPFVSSQSSMPQTADNNEIQYLRSASNINLSTFNDKVTPLKDKQMVMSGDNTYSQQPLSIVDNNQQPMPCSTGSIQQGLNSCGTKLQNTPSRYVRNSDGKIVVQREEHTLDMRESLIATPTSNASFQNVGRGKQYEFDGVRGMCYVCDVALTSLKLAQQHLNGQQHCKKSANWGGMQASQRSSTPISNYYNNSDSTNNNDITRLSTQSTREGQSRAYYDFDGNKGFCRACNSELSSPMQATQHLEGKPHKRNVQRMTSTEKGISYPLYCEICKKPFTGQESARQHFISDKHHRNEAVFNSQVLEEYDNGMKVHNNGEIWYFCKVCRKVLNTFDQLNIHLRSHTFPELEGQGASPRLASASGDPNGSIGTAGNQGVDGNDQDRLGQFHPYSRENSRSSIDQVSLEHIKELLAYGENPVINAEIAVSRGDALDPLHLLQEAAYPNAEVSSAASPQVKVEGSRQIKGRGDFIEQTGNDNYHHQSPLFRVSSSPSRYQMSPTDNNVNLLRNQPITDPWSGGSAFHAVGNNANPYRQTSETTNTNTTANSTTTAGNGGNPSGRGSPNDPDNAHVFGNVITDTESSTSATTGNSAASMLSDSLNDPRSCSIFGNVMTGVRPSANKSGNRDRGHRNAVNLDQAEHEENSDDDDDDNNDARMNIQGEEKHPFNETLQKTSTLPPNDDTRQALRKKNYCELCDKQMNASKSYKAHLIGKLHQLNLSSSRAPIRFQGPVNKCYEMKEEDFQSAFEMTKNTPRGYQIYLMDRAMRSDHVVYLPTGTGKTMVSVLTIGKMLENNPKRPVIFLVDKVLLVIQQARYIKTELEGKKFKRMPLQCDPNTGANGDIVERELTLAFVCGGLLCNNNLPIWQHDIIVTTADYCINMLNNGIILWEDFSLAVLDEVHHCVKSHPYRKLIREYHLKSDYPMRPKILGLTASPAGKSSVELTYTMLQSLLKELGNADIAIVGKDKQSELKLYQSSTSLHPICVPLTDMEKDFKRQCFKYFLLCYSKLAPLCTTLKNFKDPPCSYFYDVLTQPSEETLHSMTNSLFKDDTPLSDILPFIFEAECVKDAEERQKNVFDSLRHHTFQILLHIADIATGVDFEELKSDFKESDTNLTLKDVKSLGLPCNIFYSQILAFEQVEDNVETTMTGKLIQILQDPEYIDWSKQDAMALVLVRQRKNAKSLSRNLKHKQFVQNNSLRVTHLVGHGKGTQDKGMAVKDQKKVLDNQKKFNIIVATSIAEEGVDINTVELVVSMNPPSNVTALVQMRGRARKMGSRFVILCSSQEEMMKLEELQQHEKNMTEATEMCLINQESGKAVVQK